MAKVALTEQSRIHPCLPNKDLLLGMLIIFQILSGLNNIYSYCILNKKGLTLEIFNSQILFFQEFI